MELVLTLPILMFLLFGLFEFSVLFHARSAVVEASRIGARLASLAGSDAPQVQNQVRRMLPADMQKLAEVACVPGKHSGDTVVCAVKVPMGCACPDLLWPVGYSIDGRDLYAETVMVKE